MSCKFLVRFFLLVLLLSWQRARVRCFEIFISQFFFCQENRILWKMIVFKLTGERPTATRKSDNMASRHSLHMARFRTLLIVPQRVFRQISHQFCRLLRSFASLSPRMRTPCIYARRDAQFLSYHNMSRSERELIANKACYCPT